MDDAVLAQFLLDTIFVFAPIVAGPIVAMGLLHTLIRLIHEILEAR